MSTVVRSLSVSLAFVFSSYAVALDAYKIVDLGGTGNSFAWSVNENGDVAGSTANTTSAGSIPPDGVPFVYSNGVMTELPTFGGPGVAFDVNNVGQVVGYAVDDEGVDHAVMWENGTMIDLGVSQESYSRAHAINDAGQIVGIFADQNGDEHTFLYESGVITNLGPLGVVPWSEFPYIDINEQGIVASFSNDNDSGLVQARLYDNGTPIELGTPSELHSMAVAVNESGLAVGSMVNGTSIFLDFPQNASVVLFSDNGPVELAVPDNIDIHFGMAASGVNNRGQVVGGVAGAFIRNVSSGLARGFIYEEGVGVVDINELLVDVETSDDARLDLQGWEIIWGEKINSGGMIAAVARFGLGGRQAVLLVPFLDNVPPVLEAIGDIEVDEGESTVVPLFANDRNPGDTVSFSMSGPAFVSMADNGDGEVLAVAPGFEDAGVYEATVTVTDSAGATDSQTFSITVANVNRAPILDPIGDQSVHLGNTLLISLSASDPDGDRLIFGFFRVLSGAEFPSGVDFTDSGDGAAQFSWTPTQPGEFGVRFSVLDFTGGLPTGIDEEVITILVEAGDGCNGPLNPSDLDADCDVDGDDRNVFRSSLGTCAGDAAYIGDADYDGDQCVTLGDYRIWYGHFTAAQ